MALHGAHLLQQCDIYASHASFHASSSSLSIHDGSFVADHEATVVAITRETSQSTENSDNAIHAEFVGQDFSRPTAAFAEIQAPSSRATTMSRTSIDDIQQETTEATVIDSAPLDYDSDIPPWRITEEAQILEDSADLYEDRKPAAMDSSHMATSSFLSSQAIIEPYISESSELETHLATADVTATFITTGNEAEVVCIQEEVHPAEDIRAEPCAEFVGTDYTATVAVATGGYASTSHHMTSSSMTLEAVADSIIEPPSAIGEATVVQSIVPDDNGSNTPPKMHSLSPSESDIFCSRSLRDSTGTRSDESEIPIAVLRASARRLGSETDNEEILLESLRSVPTPRSFGGQPYESSVGAQSSTSSSGTPRTIHQVSKSEKY
jgi:hypothetical protein